MYLKAGKFFFHCYPDDFQILFTFEGIPEAENKLSVISIKVDQLIRSRQLKLYYDKIKCIIVTPDNGLHRIV